jgi:ATP-dependent Lhr-like helicase
MQLVVHAPFGQRVNRAWGLALRKRFCLTFDFELQAAATDDGILLSLGPQHSFPLDAVFAMVRRTALDEDLAQAALVSPMFANRWRWNASRALALLRHEGGRRVPMPLQRMRADDLLAAVFPAQVACAENAGRGPVPIPDHPLVRQTMDDCLHEAMDADGLGRVLDALDAGRITASAIDTVAPSPMTHEILNSNPYTYLDDAPLEERRARAVSLRRTDPDLAGGLGALDPAAIAEVRAQAWPTVRDDDELHDTLLSLGLAPEPEVRAAGWAEIADRLVGAGRATWAHTGGAPALVAAERVALARLALPGLRIDPPVRELPSPRGLATTEEEALRAIVGGWLECTGPVTAIGLAARTGLPVGRVAIGLGALEAGGAALRGRFTPGTPEEEWCERGLLARIHRLTLGALRREIEPVTAADLMRFLFRWQHVLSGTQLHGRQGLLEIVRQLEGVELPARAWEEQVLPARVARWDPDDLEHLCLAGAVAWGRLRVDPPPEGESGPRPKAPTRAAPLAFVLREDLPWLLAPTAATAPAHLGSAAGAVLEVLERCGASFLPDIARTGRLLPATVEEALWTLVAHGLVTGDGIAGLRALLAGPDEGGRRRRLRALRGARARLTPTGRWSLLRAGVEPGEPDPLRWARLALARWGVVTRELLARESRLPSWRVLLGALRTLEARGEIRGGRFVAGLVGEQFALPAAVEALRAVRRQVDRDETVVVAAADPLNLAGVLVPGPRIPPAVREVIAFRAGAVAEVGELGAVLSRLRRTAERA